MPSTSPFKNLFGRNPFSALQEHMRAAVQAVEVVPELFKALAEADQGRVAILKDQVFAFEAEADRIKNELRDHLPRGLFLPVNRRDLLEVLDMQDSMADTAQDIAELLLERQMTIPRGLEEPLQVFVEQCVSVCRYAATIIEELDELLEMGFGGRDATKVEDMIGKLNQQEDETDVLGVELARALFKLENEIDPVSVIFWYRLIDWIGDLADYAEKVGNRLRLMTAH
jgi:predicted phosphate transport protein (TIGR00153 family)